MNLQVFQVMEGVTESLAGRIALFHLYPFSWDEIETIPGKEESTKDDRFVIDQIIQGFYPEFFVTKDLEWSLWHGSYLSTYIERDIRNIKAISDLGRFQNFVKLLAARAGNLLNISEVAKEAGVSQPTAKSWISILESTYIIYLLKPYFRNHTKRQVKSPKLYFVDTGLLCYLLGIDTHDRFLRSAEKGSLFENMVIMECIKRLASKEGRFECFFYRTPSGVEVDLICEHSGKTYAYEIKFAKTLNRNMALSLSNFKKDHPVDFLKILSLSDKNVFFNKEVETKHWSSLLKEIQEN